MYPTSMGPLQKLASCVEGQCHCWAHVFLGIGSCPAYVFVMGEMSLKEFDTMYQIIKSAAYGNPVARLEDQCHI